MPLQTYFSITAMPPKEVQASLSTTPPTNSSSVSRSYMEGFTIHGLSKVFMGKLWEKVYWLFILMAVLGFVSYKIHGFHSKYKSHEFRTEIRMVDADDYVYPEIRICSDDLYKHVSLWCYKNLSLYRKPCFGEDIILKEYQLGKYITPAKDYRETSSCIRIRSPDLKKSLIFSVKGYKTRDTAKLFKVYVGDKLEDIGVGRYSLRISDVKIINRLSPPFKSNCGEGENVFPGPYTREKCIDTLALKHMLKKCDDVWDHWRVYVQPNYKKGWDVGNRNKSDENAIRCIASLLEYYMSIPKETFALSQCPLPCKELSFEWDIRMKGSLNERYGKASQLDVKFQSKRVTEITEIPSYTSDDFFSDVGSWLGLLVGMSFLSIVELVTFISTAIVERLCR